MKATDFLTILGIGLAVWALIPKKERKFILMFFSKVHLILLAISILFLHYLFSFYWLAGNWFPALNAFITPKGIPSSTWAYIFSFIIIAFPVSKVLFGFFATSRKTKLIELYKTLIKDDEIDFLVEYIKKYHIENVISYLKGISKLPQKDAIDMIMRRKTKTDREYKKIIKHKRLRFAANVYGEILQREDFVRKTANKNPEILAKVFTGMESGKAANEGLVKLYIEELFESKNQGLIAELKIVENFSSSIEDISKDYELPILYGLLSNTKVAVKNYVWYPVGEGAKKSLKYDKAQREFLHRKFDYKIESELWNYKIYIAIIYFKHMVKETIYRDSEWHMWLFYYQRFTELLIEIIPEENDYRLDDEKPSFAHALIVDQLWIMRDWLELAKKLNVKYRIIDTVKCLGSCLRHICNAPDEKIALSFKIRQLDLFMSLWFKYNEIEENKAIKLTKEWLNKMFLNPKYVDWGKPSEDGENDIYIEILKETWERFDKVPYEGFEDTGLINKFKETTLHPLGITS